MQDEEFLLQFENCTLPKENFGHIGHLRMCWLYLTHHDAPESTQLIITGIQRYAASLGASHIYDEALTRAWIARVQQAMDQTYPTFAEFIADHPELLSK